MENSLCINCNYINDCNLTSSKNFVWSCSEFKTTPLNYIKQQTIISQKDFELKNTKQIIEIL